MARSENQKPLPWKIEAFREYLTYETLQQAAAVLSIFEGETFEISNPRIVEMQKILESRTNKSAWVPKRSGSEDINWNLEGDVTRNKGRVLTSMLILYPKDWSNGKVKLTEFGHALGNGRITKRQYYDFILTHFKYPHPAWTENWNAWRESQKELHPFLYILQALTILYQHSPESAYLTTEEIADYLHPNPDPKKLKNYINEILEARKERIESKTKRSDDIHRKINDILGFLCLTDYCYFFGKKVYLNLLVLYIL